MGISSTTKDFTTFGLAGMTILLQVFLQINQATYIRAIGEGGVASMHPLKPSISILLLGKFCKKK